MTAFPPDSPVFTVNAPGIERAHAALTALVTEATGVYIPDRNQIQLQRDGQMLAKIEITDDSVWREFAHDLGFRP